MFDRYFAPALTFAVLVSATLALASEMVHEARGTAPQQARAEVVVLPAVTVVGKRAQAVALAGTAGATAQQ